MTPAKATLSYEQRRQRALEAERRANARRRSPACLTLKQRQEAEEAVMERAEFKARRKAAKAERDYRSTWNRYHPMLSGPL
jgi:hypothetical protein